MSNVIGRYKEGKSVMEVIAVIGEKWGRDVVIYVKEGKKETQIRLSEKQTRHLIKTLLKRIQCEAGYSATDTSIFDENYQVYVNIFGEKVIK